MSGWVAHDGRGVPPDAKPGITLIKWLGWLSREQYECVWDGSCGIDPWDWGKFGSILDDPRGVVYIGMITHYRNPSTDAAVEALKALADNPKRKVKEAMR